jgi:alpha-glucoside transport system permease protein
MDNIAGKRSALVWVVHLSALMLVILWTVPTAGLLKAADRDLDPLFTKRFGDVERTRKLV